MSHFSFWLKHALEDMEADVEVTVNYGYNYTAEPNQPEWFKQLWLEYYGNESENDISSHNENESHTEL